jgi:serine/threonine protein kinase
MIAKLMTEAPRPLRTLRDDVPPSVDETILRALEKDPDRRFSSARDFGDAIMLPGSSTSGNVERILPMMTAAIDGSRSRS